MGVPKTKLVRQRHVCLLFIYLKVKSTIHALLMWAFPDLRSSVGYEMERSIYSKGKIDLQLTLQLS